MRWNSLGWDLKRKLEALYDQRHTKTRPVKPEEFVAPEQHKRALIRTADNTDLYVRMETGGSYRSRDHAKGTLRLVGSGEHVEFNLPIEVIPQVIEQLQHLHADMLAHNVAYDAHLKASEEYEKAQKEYQEQRELALEKILDSGKYTEQQIKHEPDKIPF